MIKGKEAQQAANHTDDDNQNVKTLLLHSNHSIGYQANRNGDTGQTVNSIGQIHSIGKANQPKEDEKDIEEAQMHWNSKNIEKVACSVLILKEVKDNKQRLYYIRWAIENKASVISLKRALVTDIYNVQPIPNNFSQTLPSKNLARKALEMFKDEYLLDFINVEEIGERDLADIDERVVEQQIIHNVKNFIMTFGKDFTFVGNQYHLEVFEVEQYPDLLFFNRELNCLVCVELKKGDFKPSYLGQLTAYLRILDDTVKKPHENPTIGIILCKDFNKDFVEYVIQDYHKPMGVARYTTTAEMPEQLQRVLPNIEELRKVLSNQPTDK